MGITYASLQLSNPLNKKLESITTQALVDTAATYLCIPQRIANELQLSELEKRKVTLADGSQRSAPYVGPIQVVFEERRCFVGAIVLGEESLLGAIPLEDMDLIIHPNTRSLIANPEALNAVLSISSRAQRAEQISA